MFFSSKDDAQGIRGMGKQSKAIQPLFGNKCLIDLFTTFESTQSSKNRDQNSK